MSSQTTETQDTAGLTRLVRTWLTPDPWASMLIVHGLGEHSGRYERTGELFAQSGIAVRSFDLLGHGKTGGPRAFVESFSDYLDQVEEELDQVRVAGIPTVLLGHSLGGLIVLDYVLDGRPQPDALVASAPGLGGGKAWQRMLAPVLSRVAPKTAIPAAITGEQLSRDPEVGVAYFADPLVLAKVTTRLGGEMFAAGDRVRSRLDGLGVPTLVVHGGADALVPAALSAPLASNDNIERRLYPKLRHELFNEPEGPEIVGDVIEWLKRLLDSQTS